MHPYTMDPVEALIENVISFIDKNQFSQLMLKASSQHLLPLLPIQQGKVHQLLRNKSRHLFHRYCRPQKHNASFLHGTILQKTIDSDSSMKSSGC
mmetsp:Transcript_1370/g.3169  ORF Transcript_1370/g.3169 Transcript_1370/m.3169 type:complete len:95 (-) Transcript_1370:2194-2478(-)